MINIHYRMPDPNGYGAEFPEDDDAPLATTYNGTTQLMTHDELAVHAYTEAGSWHHVVLFKGAPEPVNVGYLVAVESTSGLARPYWRLFTTVTTGLLQVTVRGSGASLISHITALAAADSSWHVVQISDQDIGGGSGQIYVQMDGGARVSAGSYTRFAVSPPVFPTYYATSAHVVGPGPTTSSYSAQTEGYRAMITGHAFSVAEMDAIWDAFDTGGGKSDTTLITTAIQAAAGGTIRWAGDIDGLGNPDISTVGAEPIFVGSPTVGDADY